jgi:hypothetical protein
MSRDLSRLVRSHEKFGIVPGSRDLMALDLAGRRQLALDVARASAPARSPSDAIADFQLSRHASLRTKFSPNVPDAIRLQAPADRRGEFGFHVGSSSDFERGMVSRRRSGDLATAKIFVNSIFEIPNVCYSRFC